MKRLLGFRQYLNSEGSYKDLKKLLSNCKKAVENSNDELHCYIAICGANPVEFIKASKLFETIEFLDFANFRYSPNQLVKNLIGNHLNGNPIKVIYYSPYPEGLTYPLNLLTQLAVFLNFDHLGVSDSDFQMSFFELMRMFDFHCQRASINHPAVTFPKRERRSLDAENYPINRWAMEDLENLYVYFLSNIKYLEYKLDIQSGVVFTNRRANILLDFNRVGKWIGNLHLAIALLRESNINLFSETVGTNHQNESSISFQVQCHKIDELYDYYLIPLENIIRIALDNPQRYLMDDWTKGFSPVDIKDHLENILHAYHNFKRGQ